MRISVPFQKYLSQRAAMVVIALVALLLLKNPLLWMFAALERPFAAVGNWMSRNTALIFVSEESLRAQVDVLQRERASLAVDRAAFLSLEEENSRLKRELDFLQQRELPALASYIVSQSREGAHARRFLINRGSADGIVPGLPVVVDEGILVGKIVAVSEHTATVAELSDAQIATAVTLLNRTRTIGLAEGSAGALLLIRFIPHDEIVETNALVITSGLEERVPSGLVVGLVNSVRTDPSAPFQEAVVEPLADIRKHRAVFVLMP